MKTKSKPLKRKLPHDVEFEYQTTNVSKKQFFQPKLPHDADLQYRPANVSEKQYFEPIDEFRDANIGEPAHSHNNIASHQCFETIDVYGNTNVGMHPMAMFHNRTIGGSTCKRTPILSSPFRHSPHPFDQFPVGNRPVLLANYISHLPSAKTSNQDHTDVMHQNSILPAKSRGHAECYQFPSENASDQKHTHTDVIFQNSILPAKNPTQAECSLQYIRRSHPSRTQATCLQNPNIQESPASNRVPMEYVYLGNCTCVCRHCGAMFWECEKNSKVSWGRAP
nr:hypothetical protein [Tanacetum cinerariifolium]